MSTTEQKPDTGREMPWPAETGVWATYKMHCHCGAIRWTMKISPPLLEEEAQGKGIYRGITCNCSHCDRSGAIAAHPKTENVHFTQGLEHRSQYLSGNKQNPHWFCSKCGSDVGTDITGLTGMLGQEKRYAINLRMLADVPLEKIETKPTFIMRDMPPKYNV